VTGDIFYADADTLEAGQEATIYRLGLYNRGKETLMRPGGVGDGRRVDLRFGLDRDGEIYLLTKADGMIRQVAPHEP
jgi:hypothetical protein